MSLKDTIQNDMKAALLGGNRFVGDTLRNLKAAILNEEVALSKRDVGLTDEEVEKVIAREVKKRTESAALYEQNGRPELAEVEKQELEVLAKYLPQQLSEDEIQAIVVTTIAELSASGLQAMGQVIGAVKSKVGNAADGALIAKLVKEELSR